MRKEKIFSLCLMLCVTLIVVACTPPISEPGYIPSLNAADESENGLTADNESTISEQTSPAPEWLDPGYESTPTPPPIPTPLPTPPTDAFEIADTAELAFVSETADSFWIYFWQGNEIWRMDDQSDSVELLLDTQEKFGQWLTAVPEQLVGTECCLTGPRVVVSPDGEMLALVMVDEAQLTSKDTPFTFSIYVFEIETGDSYFVDEGTLPKWSPDSQQLAYVSAGGLWITDIEDREARQLVPPDTTRQQSIGEITWLPSGMQIAYLYDEGLHRIPTMWLIDTVGELPPRQLINSGFSIYQMVPSPDGEVILFVSAQGSRDSSRYHRARNLWSVALNSGELKHITQDMSIDRYFVSPDGQWIFLSGYRLYERSEETYERDLWLINRDDNELYRLTADYGLIEAVGWSPNGLQPLAWDGISLFSVTSADDTLLRTIAPSVTENFAIGGAK